MRELLDRGEDGKRKLIAELLPTIHFCVGQILRRFGWRRRTREYVEDLTQEVLLSLFANDARALRAWDPARGSSFLGFVRMLTKHKVYAVLRSSRRPWGTEDLHESEVRADVSDTTNLENRISSQQFAKKVFAAVELRLSDLGRQMFRWLIIEQRPVEEICALAEMKPGTVHVWRNRLLNLLREAARELEQDS